VHPRSENAGYTYECHTLNIWNGLAVTALAVRLPSVCHGWGKHTQNNVIWDHVNICQTDALEQCYRFPIEVRVYVDDGSERQPGCHRTTADHQRLDPDAEEGHWRFSVIQSKLAGIPWRVWITDNQRQLLVGSRQDISFATDGQRQTQNWGNRPTCNCGNPIVSSFNGLVCNWKTKL